MSDVAMRSSSDGGAFSVRTVAILLAVGLATFVGAILLMVYAPSSTPTGGTKAHALSDAAIGYSAIVRLARATDHQVRVIRDDSQLRESPLLIVTPPLGSTPLGDLISGRPDQPTLIVLPKWRSVTDPRHPSWVVQAGLIRAEEPQGVLAPNNKLTVTRSRSGARPLIAAPALLHQLRGSDDITFSAPQPLQSIAGDNLLPLLTDQDGRIVLAQLGDRPFYVLADPDLLDNLGMRREVNARSALAMLDALNSYSAGFDIDVTAVGLGRQRSPLQLAFEPPFVAMTLTVLAAMLLAAWQAFARFGPAVHRERAIAFGKRALVDNSAMLIRKAGRQATMGTRYAEVVRERAVTAFGVPTKLRDGAIDDYLDKLTGREKFSTLAQAVSAAEDNHALVAAARALHEWQKEKNG
jgi:hypothetical protein